MTNDTVKDHHKRAGIVEVRPGVWQRPVYHIPAPRKGQEAVLRPGIARTAHVEASSGEQLSYLARRAFR